MHHSFNNAGVVIRFASNKNQIFALHILQHLTHTFDALTVSQEAHFFILHLQVTDRILHYTGLLFLQEKDTKDSNLDDPIISDILIIRHWLWSWKKSNSFQYKHTYYRIMSMIVEMCIDQQMYQCNK
jgi:hypothetical protein